MNGSNYENYVRAYMTDVYRMAMTCCGNVYDAEDVTQTVFIKLLESDKVFESDVHVKNWLLKVTVNEARSLMRSAWKKHVISLEESEEPCFTITEHSDLWYAIQELEQKYRTVVHLYYYEDYSVREIAGILDVSETAVQTRLLRARRKLMEKLNRSRGQ